MTTRFSRRAMACALLATSALATPAFAQSTVQPPYRTIDDNGVDLVQGDFRFNFAEASIGSGSAELPLVRISNANDFSQWDQLVFVQPSAGDIRIGMPDGSFELFSGTTNTKANGATLTSDSGGYTYTSAGGTKIRFVSGGAAPAGTNFCDDPASYPCHMLPDTVTYPDGRVIRFTFDLVSSPSPTGPRTYVWRLASIANSFGYSITFTYKRPLAIYPPPSDWYVRTSATLARNNVTQATVSYAYPSSGVTDITDPAGNVWEVTGNSIRRPGESTPFLQVALSGSIVSSVTKNGVTTNYSRSVVGSTATMTVTDPLSHTKVIASNLTISRPTSIQDENGHTTGFQYDTNGRLTRITRPEGNYTQYTYDARGNVTQTRNVAKSGSGLADIVASASFDTTCSNTVTCNQPNSTTDAKGNETDYVYDATHGGVTSITRPAPTTGAVRPQTRYSYTQITSSSGDPVYMPTGVSACQTLASCAGTSDETKTSAAYDAYGNLTSQSSGDGAGALTATRTMTYDALGDMLTVDGPLAGSADTTRYRYDAARRMIGVTDPDPDGAGALKMRAIRLTLRSDGQASRKELGTVNSQSDTDWAAFSSAQQVDISYDANARVATQKLSSGGTNYALSQYSYDSLGRSDCVAVRMNPAIYGSLPSSACTLGTAGSYGNDRITQTVYDAASEPTQFKEAVGTSDAATERTLTYSNNGKLATLLDGESNLTTYEYDGFDRLAKTRYPGTTKGSGTSSTTDYEQLSYDANSNVTSHRLRDGNSIGFTYDNLNRVTFKDLPGSEPDVTYVYDNLGRMTSASQTGNSLSFTYDALSRKTSESGPIATVSQQFDLAGNRTQLSTSHGYLLNFQRLTTGEMKSIADGNNTVHATFTYDDLGRRIGLSYLDGSSASWSYDAVSRLASLTQDLNGTTYDLTKTFSYNPASQIVSETRSNDAYAYTGNSNINQATVTNGLNQLATVGGTSAAYDAKGNLTTDPVSGKTYGYDSQNELTSGSGGASLTYDPLGRLYQVAAPSGTRRFLYAPDDSGVDEPITEYDGSGNFIAHYGFGPGPDEPLLWWDIPAGVLRFLHADERGSIVAVSDGTGASPTINRYDDYGNPQSGNQGRFQYTSQMWLSEIGLQYSKARMYDPKGGRFMQTDPVGYDAGANPYDYVLGDPVNLVDPLGLGDAPPNPKKPIEPPPPPPLVGGPLDGGNCSGCIGPSDPSAQQSIDQWGGYYLGSIWIAVSNMSTLMTGAEHALTGILGAAAGGDSAVTARNAIQKAVCSALPALGENGRIRLGADVQAYGGIGGAAGAGAFLDARGNLGWDDYYGWGAGLGSAGGAGLTVGNDKPRTGRNPINHLQGTIGGGWVGASGTYSSAEGGSGSGGIGLGPKLGLAVGSVSGSQESKYWGNICS